MKLSQEQAETVAKQLNYRHNGLVLAIAQDLNTSRVLMVAFMNEEAVKKSLTTGMMHYWSLERGKLWKKGEQSGNSQYIEEVLVDCDLDAMLFKVRQLGGACHRGFFSCFFRKIAGKQLKVVEVQVFDPKKIYK
jgi:phosphoribosyl-AMP cyclohydrolase